MNILHVYKTYYPDSVGGVEKLINQLAISSESFGIKTQILTVSQKPKPSPVEIDNHWVHQAKRSFHVASTEFSLEAFSSFRKLIKQVDLVHYHYPWPFMDLLHFSTRMHKPSIVTYHSDIVRQKILSKVYSPLKHFFLASVDKIVVTSPNYLETSRDLIRYAKKTEVIPIGLAKSNYPVPDEERLLYWKKKLPPRFFLFVGVLRYYKGLHTLLEAIKNTPYPVVIAGSGPIEAELKKYAEKAGMSWVFFLGQVSEEDKVVLLTLAYGIIFPSNLRSEAFGISLLEGAMYGKPLISTEIGTGTSYININQQTGLVVKPSCPHSLLQALNFMWENPQVTHRMGLESSKRYQQLFTADTMAERYYKLYKDVVANYC